MDRPPRPDFDWRRLNDGEMPLGELQRIDDAACRPVDEEGGGDSIAHAGMAGVLTPHECQPVWGKILGVYTGGEVGLPLYEFRAISHEDNEAVIDDDGLTGVALEVNSGTDVPSDVLSARIDRICLFWPSEDGHEGDAAARWRFSDPPAGAAGGGTLDHEEDTINPDYLLTGSVADTSLEFTIPAPGTYLFHYTLGWWVQTVGGAGGERIYVHLWDVTNAAPVSQDFVIVARTFAGPENGLAGFHSTHTFPAGTYPATVRLRARHDGYTGGSNTAWLTAIAAGGLNASKVTALSATVGAGGGGGGGGGGLTGTIGD